MLRNKFFIKNTHQSPSLLPQSFDKQCKLKKKMSKHRQKKLPTKGLSKNC